MKKITIKKDFTTKTGILLKEGKSIFVSNDLFEEIKANENKLETKPKKLTT